MMCFSSLPAVQRLITIKDRYGNPLVNYDLALICLPSIMLGSVIGTSVNSYLPSGLLILGLLIVNLYQLRKNLSKIESVEPQSNIEQQGITEGSGGSEALKPKKAGGKGKRKQGKKGTFEKTETSKDAENSSGNTNNTPVSQPCPNLSSEDLKKKQIIELALAMFIITLAKSDEVLNKFGLSGNTTIYWILQLATVAVAALFLNRIVTEFKTKEQQSREPLLQAEGQNNPYSDVIKPENVQPLIGISFATGILGGLIGLGGGMVLGPYLLQMKIHKVMLYATTQAFIVLGTGLSIIQAAVTGKLALAELLWFGALAYVGSAVVAPRVTKLVQESDANNLLRYGLSGIIGICVFLLLYYMF
jgi:uncharacterized membrane protein YfcA